MSKQRIGFVSNSSSSSFIIAVNNKSNECPCCHRHDKNIIDTIAEKTDGWSDTEVNCRGKEETIKYIKENFFSDDEYQLELVDKILKVDNSKEIAYVDISYHDEDLNDEFNVQVKNGTIEILYTNN